MSNVDVSLERKHQTLEEKYRELRRNHKKLAGVALELVEALEEFIRGGKNPDMNRILLSCSKIYPGLVSPDVPADGEDATPDGSLIRSSEGEANVISQVTKDEVEDVDKTQDEYYEGFWSRPKIPRTPQV